MPFSAGESARRGVQPNASGIWKQIIRGGDPSCAGRSRGKRSSKIHELLGLRSRDPKARESERRAEGAREKDTLIGDSDREKEMARRRLGKRDHIGAILEEVINRCESKIDLFCSG